MFIPIKLADGTVEFVNTLHVLHVNVSQYADQCVIFLAGPNEFKVLVSGKEAVSIVISALLADRPQHPSPDRDTASKTAQG